MSPFRRLRGPAWRRRAGRGHQEGKRTHWLPPSTVRVPPGGQETLASKNLLWRGRGGAVGELWQQDPQLRGWRSVFPPPHHAWDTRVWPAAIGPRLQWHGPRPVTEAPWKGLEGLGRTGTTRTHRGGEKEPPRLATALLWRSGHQWLKCVGENDHLNILKMKSTFVILTRRHAILLYCVQ